MRDVADVALTIGGVSTSLDSADAAVLDVARSRYAGFLTGAVPEWRLHADRDATLRPALDLTTRWNDATGRLAAERHDFSASLDVPARAGRVSLAVADHIALDSFLRVTWSLALLPVDGLLVHAASVVRGGRAFLFAGRSGRGKTTIARLSTDDVVLADELSIVRLDASGMPPGARGARCHGSPFYGDLARPGPNESAPLAAVCLIDQADRHVLEPLTPARAVAALLPHVVCFVRAADVARRVFDVAAEIVETVPCFTLSFRRDAGFWELLDHV